MKRLTWTALPPALLDESYLSGPLKILDRRKTNAMRRYYDAVMNRTPNYLEKVVANDDDEE